MIGFMLPRSWMNLARFWNALDGTRAGASGRRGTPANRVRPEIESLEARDVPTENQAPTITGGYLTAQEDVQDVMGGYPITLGDPDGSSLHVTARVDKGALTWGSLSGQSISFDVALDPIYHLSWDFAQIHYLSPPNFFGKDILHISIVDEGNSGAIADVSIFVLPQADAIIANTLVVSANPISVDKGSSLAGQTIAAFTSEDPSERPQDFSATIDWGDGNPVESATVEMNEPGSFQIVARATSPHHNVNVGSYVLHMTVSGSGGRSAESWSSLQVTKPAIALTAAAGPLNATAGTSASLGLASFTNSSGQSYSISVNWGDGTSAQTIASTGSVNVAHSFANPGIIARV